MKKVYTIFKNRVLLSLAFFLTLTSHSVLGQVCGPVVENFNTVSNNTAGFTGDFSYDATGLKLIRRMVIGTAVYSVTTPTYQLPGSTTTIGYGVTLDGTEQIARVEVVIMYISTLTNQLTTIFLGQFVPNYGGGTFANLCRGVDIGDLPGFPTTNGKYRFRFDLTSNTGIGLATNTMTFDDFKTTGTAALSPLPVAFIGFEAKKANNGTQLTWKVAGEENVNRYEVERSNDGRVFTSIGNISSKGLDTYVYTDANSSGIVYYRIKNVDNDGKFKYSTIARLVKDKSDIVIKTFPQPARDQLTVQHPSITGKALITISTGDGRIVRTVTPTTGSMQTYLDVTSLQGGMYMLRFDSGDGATQTMKIIKQ